MRFYGLYSKMIGGLKILLPLGALILLSTMFLLSRSRDAALDISSFLNASDGTTLQTGIGQPKYAGTTDQGDHVLVRAEQATPLYDGLVVVLQVAAEIALTDGSHINVSADSAQMDDTDNLIDLNGTVLLETSTGYRVSSETFQMQTDRVSGQITTPVQATGPAGELTADRLVFTQDQTTGDVQFHFTGNVKLVYEPQQK